LRKKGIGGYFVVEKLVLDTSVLVEYIVLRAPYRPKVGRLFDKASTGEVKLYVSAVTLSETFYVASRIYQIAKVVDPNVEALDYVEWIKKRAQVVEVDEDIALRAGELKKLLHIALPDCYVIATAEVVEATPIFKRAERVMEPILNNLRKLKVKFLDEVEV